MVRLRKNDFTLGALRLHLITSGYAISVFGEDIAAEVSGACALLGVPHTPRFYVVVEAAEDLLTFATSVMSATWSVFERGRMEFKARVLDDGRAQVAVVQLAETSEHQVE